MSNIAAIYVRVSTQKESQKDSPEHQKMLCEEKAKDLGLQIQYVYEDHSSGTSIIGRPEIINMLADAQRGYFSTIIFASLSRFARDTQDALDLKKKFVDVLGIRLISIEDVYDSKTNNNEMMFTVISVINQELSKQISVASKRGIQKSALRGNFTGSTAPFGYKKILIDVGGEKRKSLEILPEQSKWVKMIFGLYVHQNMGEKAIVNYLNNEEVPAPRSGAWGYKKKGVLQQDGVWGTTTIQRILQNEAYTGRNVFNKYESKIIYPDIHNTRNKKKILRQRNKEDWIRMEEPLWEALIDDETFQKAQEIRLLRGGGTRGGIRKLTVNAFAGIAKCAHCGSNFVSMKSGKVGKEGQEYRYLICSRRRRLGVSGCENELWVPYEKFRDELLTELTLFLRDAIDVEAIAEEVKVPTYNKEDDGKQKIEKLEQQINENRKFIFELRKQYMRGDIKDETQYLYEKGLFEKEIEDLLKKQQAITVRELPKPPSNEEVKESIKKALEELQHLNFSDVKTLQMTLQQLIHKIEIFKDGSVDVYTPLGKL
ncbi:recombinase family protein [Neobacillus ginsengisoli]|uniref:DNA invertase Pin-like site-specific DNA recombinase n=1 Tax=Neobacillus ginsengisoli TaxID=904295 RepID=A0ABT9XQ38_9BACI|nr:recombinase family protein [Neobacillus ginsengisoli]MDQ0197099.1 DNA invertase Pin-like site-specific DNA recombinase [Neobacillus ginsengisoli]